MTDRLVRALVRGTNLIAVTCVATEAAREARRLHGLAPSSAAILGEALTAGFLLGSLQKSEQNRINLQIACDGPIGGLLVDASSAGDARGYVKNKAVAFPAGPRLEVGALLGSVGYLSVLRDIDGQFYRGSVGLEHHDLSLDLESYFARSEQVETTMRLEALRIGDDELGWVGGLMVQRLPDGDSAALHDIRLKLHGDALASAVRAGAISAVALCEALLGSDVEPLANQEVRYACSCSKERVTRALGTLSNLDLIEMIQEDHRAAIDCEFCGQKYEISEAELREILDGVDRRDAAREARRTPATDAKGNPLN